jgi:hypothetical protein
MKHAAVLYTCIGLMGTAAVVGFVDYRQSSKSGLLKGLYSDEKASSATTFIEKKVDINDYSRGPIEEVTEEQALRSGSVFKAPSRLLKKPKKPKVPPIVESPVVPTPPKLAAKEITIPVVAIPDTVRGILPGAVVVTEIETPPVEPPIPEVREVNYKSFSRAPLGNHQITKKRKKVQ